ncbi:tRNA uridine-5-carboxymethylaminomethyl(34) synthesis enzyme MnmG [bacterium]|nr:tRNA uridine-5-carboxymethylaminomethyl(34) synthesis enzyme MnmG [bacterium]
MDKNIYDVIVVGGGHAGIEASSAVAKMGMSVLLITFKKDKIGQLSCNPAVGGVGKGQLVKELDALGGEMGKATDACAVQFRTLNRSKGYAVWSSRAQVDNVKYPLYMQQVLSNQSGINILEGEVTSIIIENRVVKGVEVEGSVVYTGKTVVLASGTFLNGIIYIGLERFKAGRLEDEQSSQKLSEQLKNIGFNMLRFKTATCARLEGKTIDFKKLIPQYGDEFPTTFSLTKLPPNFEQMPCFITYTNENTHKIIKDNIDSSPLFSDVSQGAGARYCPTLEDKILKFPHHNRHHIFLEPESRENSFYYPNGLFTGLPRDIQDQFIRTIEGLENVTITKYGYGIEYDIIEPTQIWPTTETKRISNLFLAGQINGTTGYEEAGVQGLLAGINASLKVKGEPPFVLDRTTGYIGVLLDDLTTRGTLEPYRMFTSRVEYRLMLREDNAEFRLREKGYKLGLVSKEKWEKTEDKREKISSLINELKEKKIIENDKTITAFEWLRKPDTYIKDVLPETKYSEEVLLKAEIEARYAPYIERMLQEMKEFKNLEKIKIPETTDFTKISGLSLEIQEKLSQFKPMTLGQASRISGVTPAAITRLIIYFGKKGSA